ncbi:hypothetical protein MAL1_00152 [Bacteriophage DSS3_MAL1]|nr:hypothetical protein MAL1_00152 [Bacteriophage DSS3_MAL1]
MTEEEFVTAFRWIIGAALVLIILTVCPALFSAANDGAVIASIVLFVAGIITTAATIVGRADNILKNAYRTIRDAFFT